METTQITSLVAVTVAAVALAVNVWTVLTDRRRADRQAHEDRMRSERERKRDFLRTNLTRIGDEFSTYLTASGERERARSLRMMRLLVASLSEYADMLETLHELVFNEENVDRRKVLGSVEMQLDVWSELEAAMDALDPTWPGHKEPAVTRHERYSKP